jgi:tagatose 1,6-diphosphate aldolase
MGASAVKFMVYYNPQSEELADELDQLVIDTVKECHRWDLPVFLEPMSYSNDPTVSKDSPEYAAERPEIVIETARRLSQTGADVLKMEFPLDMKYNKDHAEWREKCQALSEASTVPWVLLSAGVDFEEFVPQVEIACESGASGFLAGRAIWKECATMSTEERKTFLDGTATNRLKELIDIAVEKSRPWTDFYTVKESAEDWYEAYMANT